MAEKRSPRKDEGPATKKTRLEDDVLGGKLMADGEGNAGEEDEDMEQTKIEELLAMEKPGAEDPTGSLQL